MQEQSIIVLAYLHQVKEPLFAMTRTLFSLPPYADEAFDAVSGEGADDEQCEGFASRWGGLDLDAFERAFRSGTGDDRLVGIFAPCLAQRITLVSFLIASMAPTRNITTCSAMLLGTMLRRPNL